MNSINTYYSSMLSRISTVLVLILARRDIQWAHIRAMATARRHSKLMSFDLLESQPAVDDARLGRLSFHGRVPMETPNYVAASSRGAVPHISQDMMRDNTAIKSMYTALEDCEYLRSINGQYGSERLTDMCARTGARKT